MTSVRVIENQPEWDDAVNSCGGHPLQLWGWGEVKSSHNWSAQRLLVVDGHDIIGGAQILDRSLKLPGQAVRYAPRGPFWAEGRGDDVVDALVSYLRRAKHGTVLTLEPDAETMPKAELFRPSPVPVLIPSTLIIDLAQSEDEILSGMRSGTRNYVRKTTKTLRFQRAQTDDDVREALAIYHETAERAGFALHDDQYYLDIHHMMGPASYLLGAYDEQGMVAFVWNAVSATTSWELYGGISARGQKARANYGLKFAAMRGAKEMGCSRYDLNGLLNDGISEFKQGFHKDHANLLAGSFDLPLSPLYLGYTRGVPFVRTLLRSLKRRHV